MLVLTRRTNQGRFGSFRKAVRCVESHLHLASEGCRLVKSQICEAPIVEQRYIYPLQSCWECANGDRGLLKRNATTIFVLRKFWTAQEIGVTIPSGVPRNFFRGGFNKFSWGQRERGSGGGSPLVRGSGGSCNLVQEISFHIVKFSQFLVLPTIYDDNQFICHC